MDPSASHPQPERPVGLPAFLERPGRPEDGTGQRVLQVHQLWDDVLLESHSVQPGRDLTVGDGWRWRWRVLGVDLAPAPGPLRRLLPWLVPGWSEVVAAPAADLSHPTVDEVHTLFEATDAGWTARVAAHWPVRVEHAGRFWSLQELIDAGAARSAGAVVEIPVRTDQRLAIRIGLLTVGAWTVLREAPADRPGWMPEPGLLAALSTFSAAAAMLAAMVAFSPGPPETSVEEVQEHLAQLTLTPPPPPPEPVASGGEGASGPDADPDPEPAPDDPGPPSDEEIANASGAMAALNAGAFGGMFDSGELDTRLAAAAGNLVRAKGTGGPGGFGLDGRGDGLTTGGEGEGFTCDDPTLATCMGAGGRHASGPGGFGPGKRDGTIVDVFEDPITVGGLPASAVDEVVKGHLSAIRYCYQRQLPRSPGLAGKVTVKFTIAGDGSVSDAGVARGTLDHDAVHQCIVNRFLRMQFPEPRGAGIVVVSYPFLFQPS